MFGEGDDFVLELARATLFVFERALEGGAFRSEVFVRVGDELCVGAETVERSSNCYAYCQRERRKVRERRCSCACCRSRS